MNPTCKRKRGREIFRVPFFAAARPSARLLLWFQARPQAARCAESLLTTALSFIIWCTA